MNDVIRVLHIVGSMHSGGMENFIMNLYRNVDRDKVQFDFITHKESDPAYVEEIVKLGGRIYQLPRLTRNPIKNLRRIEEIVRENSYKVVFRHTPNALVAPQLRAAGKGGAYAVCHSHNTDDPKRFLHMLGKLFLRSDKIGKFACSKAAGEWMYGSKEFEIINNAVDIDKFSFSDEKRMKIRKEFGISDSVRVYGHMGNFLPTKNHELLIDIYAKISEMDENAEFFCLGDGELKTKMMEKAGSLGIDRKMHFTGTRRETDEFLSAMDVFIFPSKFEGLPLSVIEAQAAGLPILLSDKITRDVEVTEGLLEWEHIESPVEDWAEKAIKMQSGRACQRENMAENGYDIKALAKWYEKFIGTVNMEKK